MQKPQFGEWKYASAAIAGFAMLLVVGCSSTDVSGRPAVDWNNVKVYFEEPAKPYEKIMLVSGADSGFWRWDGTGKVEKAIQEMRKKAGKMGGNGLLIIGAGDRSHAAGSVGGSWTGGSGAFGGGFSTFSSAQAQGFAIYVQP